MARVLLTGARGFIGRHCRKHLLDDGWEVHAVATRPLEEEAPEAHDGSTWHAVDLLDADAVRRLAAQVKPSHLLHLAWYTVPGDCYHSAENARWAAAGQELLAAVAEHGIRRAVIAGSCAEYEATSGRCSESDTPLAPATAYGAAKNELRRGLEAWAEAPGRSGAWARLFFLYGPGEHPDRLVPYVIRSLLREEIAECTHGEQLRDYLFVDDAAEGLVQLLDSGVEGAINIASGEARPVKDLILQAAHQLGRPDLVRLGARAPSPHETPRIEADVTRQTRELAWHPSTSLEAGLTRTIAWWRRRLESHPH